MGDIPSSVRVRTGDENEWRYSAIERASEMYEKNRSDSIGHACFDVVQFVDAIEEVLERDDLTKEQRREIAETCSCTGVEFEVETTVKTVTE